MRQKTREYGSRVEQRRRYLRASETPWNGTREIIFHYNNMKALNQESA